MRLLHARRNATSPDPCLEVLKRLEVDKSRLAVPDSLSLGRLPSLRVRNFLFPFFFLPDLDFVSNIFFFVILYFHTERFWILLVKYSHRKSFFMSTVA